MAFLLCDKNATMQSIVLRSSGSEQSAKGGNDEFSPEDTFIANDQDNRARRTILSHQWGGFFIARWERHNAKHCLFKQKIICLDLKVINNT